MKYELRLLSINTKFFTQEHCLIITKMWNNQNLQDYVLQSIPSGVINFEREWPWQLEPLMDESLIKVLMPWLDYVNAHVSGTRT